MEDDLKSSLYELSFQDGQSIASRLLMIQELRLEEPRSFDWARELICLSLNQKQGIEAGVHHEAKILQKVKVPITTRDYVAVSYRCNDDVGSYVVSTKKNSTHEPVEVRDAVLRRILSYMEHFQVPCFWIDKESTNQQDPVALEDALQCMDLIYRCSNHPLAVLETKLSRQSQLDLLFVLMSGELTIAKRPQLRRHVSLQTARKGLRLLSYLTKDPWWTRRWVFQEEYCSEMKLLIPHSKGLSKIDWDEKASLVPGEIIVSAFNFRKQATLFCLACLRSGIFKRHSDWRMCNEVLSKAKSYRTVYEYGYEAEHEIRSPSRPMSVQILRDISDRGVTKPGDTLAILANCCGYPVLLDRHRLEKDPRQNSLSLAILATYLLNGEMMWSKKRTSSTSNILQFIQAQTFDKFDPPTDTAELTFMKKCRFANVRLVEDGVKTTGHTWHVQERIPVAKIKYKPRPGLTTEADAETDCLHHLAHYLARRYPQLARDIYEYTNDKMPGHIGSEGLESVFRQTASYIVSTIVSGRTTAVAADLVIAQHTTAKSSWAVFVNPQHRIKPGSYRHYQAKALVESHLPSLIFTSTEPAEHDLVVDMNRSPDKYVSLTVYSDGWTGDGLRLLRIGGWINGLAFPGRAIEGDVVFRWPAVLLEGGPHRDDTTARRDTSASESSAQKT